MKRDLKVSVSRKVKPSQVSSVVLRPLADYVDNLLKESRSPESGSKCSHRSMQSWIAVLEVPSARGAELCRGRCFYWTTLIRILPHVQFTFQFLRTVDESCFEGPGALDAAEMVPTSAKSIILLPPSRNSLKNFQQCSSCLRFFVEAGISLDNCPWQDLY